MSLWKVSDVLLLDEVVEMVCFSVVVANISGGSWQMCATSWRLETIGLVMSARSSPRGVRRLTPVVEAGRRLAANQPSPS